jgi:quercetin dioxygenase-like cupin family protein
MEHGAWSKGLSVIGNSAKQFNNFSRKLTSMNRISLTMLILLFCLSGNAQYSKDIIVEPVLKTDTNTIGQGFIYPDVQNDEVTIARITIAPGLSTGWHSHSFPVFAYILKGTLTVELENGKSVELRENTSFSEVIRTYHNGTNKGQEDVVLIAFYLGEKGKPLSTRKE